MDDDGHINHFVLEHTDQTNGPHPLKSNKYEIESQQYWEDDNDNDNNIYILVI